MALRVFYIKPSIHCSSPVPGEFPTQRPVTRSFDVYFDLHPNKQLSKQYRGWWFETLSSPLWRHRNGQRLWDMWSLTLTLRGRNQMDTILQTKVSSFLNENDEFRLKFRWSGPINIIRALVQIMAWCRPGDKPLSDPMMIRLAMHISVTRLLWLNSNKFYVYQRRIQCFCFIYVCADS